MTMALPTLVGRTSELGVLRSALDDALACSGRTVCLVGEAGIGKTRLAREIAREASARGAGVAVGRSWDGEGAPALWMWTRLMDALGVTMPEGGRSIDAEGARFAWLDACVSSVMAAARSRALVLVADDLHTADADSLEALYLLARSMTAASILLVCTYRPVEGAGDERRSRLLARIEREARTIPLRGLGDGEIAEMLGVSLSESADHGFVNAVARATGGNALFVECIARSAQRSGFDAAHGIRGAIRGRLDALSVETRRVLRSAAVVGSTFSTPALAAALEAPLGSERDALGEAILHGLIARRDGDEHAFVHDLVRATLAEELPAEDRRAAQLRLVTCSSLSATNLAT